MVLSSKLLRWQGLRSTEKKHVIWSAGSFNMLPPLWLKPREPNNKRTIVTQKLNTIDTRWNLNFSGNHDTCQARPLCGLGRRGTIFRGSLWCAELRGWKTFTGREKCAKWHASKLTYWWIELHSIFPTLINHIYIYTELLYKMVCIYILWFCTICISDWWFFFKSTKRDHEDVHPNSRLQASHKPEC